MSYEEIIFELKRLKDLAEDVSWDLAKDIEEVINMHKLPEGDCCG